jgi:preprotein translocase subunit SecA
MSRVLLQQWRVAHLAGEGVVEREDGRETAVDRWLAALPGRFARWRSRWTVRRLRREAAAIVRAGEPLQPLDEAALQAVVAEARDRLHREGLTPAAVRQAFALVREASRRTLGKAHHPSQLMGGLTLLAGRLAEMQTGEGKTLTALLPVITVALAGAPAHVVTVNDYLAARDAETLGPVYRFFGLDVGVVVQDQPQPERLAAWCCPVVYTTNKDLVFDYLRDRLPAPGGGPALHTAARTLLDGRSAAAPRRVRALYFALVDEADSVLVDEARTPLILSAQRDDVEEVRTYARALAVAAELQADTHYRVRARERAIQLLPAAEARVTELCAADQGLLTARRARLALVQQALSALHLYRRDEHYIVRAGDDGQDKVEIVDENTGRVMPDRAWEAGLHQMIELKEGVPTTARRETLSRITYQRFFRRYLRLAGMSGTVMEVAPELRAVYGLEVVRIPTHRKVLRRDLGVRLLADAASRWAAVAARAQALAAAGRPVLIGTRSVAASEAAGRALAALGLPHTVLNARHDAEEAAIVADAGQAGRITVATNMAGRGTDIHLDDAVRAAGGLHVILTEFHDSGRVDRQLFGRAGRQGDPGSFEAIVSLDDELFRAHGGLLWRWLRRRAATSATAERPAWQGGLLRRVAQSRAAGHDSAVRRQTLANDRQQDRRLAFSGRAT